MIVQYFASLMRSIGKRRWRKREKSNTLLIRYVVVSVRDEVALAVPVMIGRE